MKSVKTITVLGAGDMGHGIAELAALKGFDVRLRDVKQEFLDKALGKVRWSLDKLAEHHTISKAEADAAFGRISTAVDLGQALAGTDLVIEAVPENMELKQKVFAEVERLAPPGAVLASNTSTMRITEIGSKLADPSRLVGMHFFNPVLLMQLVEVIPGETTSKDALAAVEETARKFGKTVVTTHRDTPGFITSRLVGTWVGAAIVLAERGVATKEQIDSALKFQAGFPMGAFELADYTGLDIGFHAGEYIASRLGSDYKPMKSLADLVSAGKLGKKTGQGFYKWDGNKMAVSITAETGKGVDPAKVLAVVANEAAKLVEQGVASAAEVDEAMRLGCAFPKGPLEWADAYGLDNVLKTLIALKVEPYELIVDLVEEGKLGKGRGGGFYPETGAGSGTGAGAMPTYETLLVATDAATKVQTVTLNRPHRLNAINDVLVRELGAALRAAEADENVRVVLLTGSTEKAFCVGAALQDAGGATPIGMAEVARQLHLVLIGMEKMGKPVVAAVNGYAFGGGMELTLACDFRVAAKRAKFAQPEVNLGLLPAGGGTQRLPKLIGLSRAKEFLMLGERVSADDAHTAGLVHRVYENETFAKDSAAFAAELAKRAPLALKFTKQLANAALQTDISAGMEMEALAFGVLSGTEDVMEGVSAMFQKIQPNFKGK
ncbi:MAG: 3-hydroxyacyl-CoA dehydrogenase/enoyl-CoA hydratase family protein [Thermoplasmatota archaeon]